jgi:glutathionyl-hydroquinone reductase
MLDTEFEALTGNDLDLCPADLREKVDATIDAIYEPVNNGVYRSGFATTQEAYEEAVTELFEAVDHWDDGVLGERRYLCGARLTEADWFMFTTLVRFDAVYHGHFKCNLRRIEDYENLSGYLRELYQVPGVAETVDIPHIKRHYYTSHESVNPTRIVPKGPILDLDTPHGRDRLALRGSVEEAPRQLHARSKYASITVLSRIVGGYAGGEDVNALPHQPDSSLDLLDR